jgi:hypothetical protein
MSRWFWIVSVQVSANGGHGEYTTTFFDECDLPDGFSRQAAFEDILKAAMKAAGWTGFPTVLFFSLEPAVLAPARGAS